jgi:chromosome segregation ATPase
MRRQAILPEELYETANRMVAEGKEVTAKGLLDELGGGSLRTIYKYFDIWKEKRPAAVAIKATEVPDGIRAQYEASWRAAQQEAAREVEALKAKALEEVEAAEKKFQDALDITDRMEKEAQEAGEQIATLQGLVKELTDQNKSVEASRATHKATAEQLQQQVKAQEQELERLHKGQAEEREQHSAQVARLELIAQQAKELHEKEKAELKEAVAEAQNKLGQMQQERDRAKATAEESRRQQEKAEEAAKADRAERDAAIKEAAELKGKAATLQEQNHALLSKLPGEDKPQKKG